MKSSKVRLILIIISSLLVGYFAGVSKIKVDWDHYKPRVAVISKEPPPEVTNVDFTMFWTVLDKLESGYYDKAAINPQKLVNGAISGMVASLDDPYTMYLPPKQNDDFKQGLAGKFEGIGAELGLKGKQIIIVSPLDGSPAQKAGIKAGDSVLKVDGKPTFGWTLNDAVEKIRGPKGSYVTLAVMHKTEDQLKDIKILRDTIQVKSVVFWTKKTSEVDEINKTGFSKANLGQKIAYIRLSQFGDTANQEWLSFANSLDLQLKKDKDIKGVVLDLRNNPGGYLNDAVFIASEFLPIGKTVVMSEDGKQEKTELKVQRQGLLLDTPLVILINKGSASASEILSGAMHDYKRATLVGETSFGKGTIQQAEDLGAGAGLHVTIAKWLTPLGTWVHMKGIDPEVAVAVDTKDQSHDAQLEAAIKQLLK